MSGFLYAGCLLAGLAAMAAIDARWRLFVFAGRPVRALLTLLAGVAFFIGWDAAGIGLGVFFRGAGPYLSGIVLGPEFPVEELLFLAFLCWLTMNLWLLATRLLATGRVTAVPEHDRDVRAVLQADEPDDADRPVHRTVHRAEPGR
ncbi:lycopene cyclase domain-containing protein [Tersicoccus sp. MR15.9]|uniref:lycopene cyclase domain-containing protein n=1 Tax=Tersicoccus mangrovi TaxID=3121635 RepID=UPI002FE665BD